MCLSDLGTAVLIGGEGADQQPCKDAFWKLEIGGNYQKQWEQWDPRATHAGGRGY